MEGEVIVASLFHRWCFFSPCVQGNLSQKRALYQSIEDVSLDCSFGTVLVVFILRLFFVAYIIISYISLHSYAKHMPSVPTVRKSTALAGCVLAVFAFNLSVGRTSFLPRIQEIFNILKWQSETWFQKAPRNKRILQVVNEVGIAFVMVIVAIIESLPSLSVYTLRAYWPLTTAWPTRSTRPLSAAPLARFLPSHGHLAASRRGCGQRPSLRGPGELLATDPTCVHTLLLAILFWPRPGAQRQTTLCWQRTMMVPVCRQVDAL